MRTARWWEMHQHRYEVGVEVRRTEVDRAMRVIYFRSRQQLSERQYCRAFPDYLLIYDTSLIRRQAINHERNNKQLPKQTHEWGMIRAAAGLSCRVLSAARQAEFHNALLILLTAWAPHLLYLSWIKHVYFIYLI